MPHSYGRILSFPYFHGRRKRPRIKGITGNATAKTKKTITGRYAVLGPPTVCAVVVAWSNSIVLPKIIPCKLRLQGPRSIRPHGAGAGPRCVALFQITTLEPAKNLDNGWTRNLSRFQPATVYLYQPTSPLRAFIVQICSL